MEMLYIVAQYSAPILIALAAALLLVAFGAATLYHPTLLLYPYLGLLLTVPQSSYGSLEVAGPSIYSRGTGQLIFPHLFWLLLGALVWSLLLHPPTAGHNRLPRCNLWPWFLGFAALLLGHVVVAVYLGKEIRDGLSLTGFSSIVWMGVLVAVMVRLYSAAGGPQELSKFLVIVGLCRALFGLGRWALGGGDPANVYSNYGGASFNLTFFDISDSLTCWLALSIAAVALASRRHAEIGWTWCTTYWTTVTVCALCIVLSYRRTAWAGALLAGAFLLLQIPRKPRIWASLGVVPCGVAAIAYAAMTRLSQTKGLHSASIAGFFHDLLGSPVGGDTMRTLELRLVINDFLNNIVLGIGAWGRFAGHQMIDWQSGPAGGTFVHSGVLHIALKSGLLGLSLTAGLITAFWLHWRDYRPALSAGAAPLAVAGVSGALFMVPDFLVGTPVPQVRTTQMLALALSLPYVASAFSGPKRPLSVA